MGACFMGIYLNPGNSGFSAIRNDIYVDKTGLIRLINEAIGTPRSLICVSRPRRFGKSFAAKMLCAYYDKTCDSSALFDDLEIFGDAQYTRHRNKYDVIYLDMTGVMGESSAEDMVPYIKRSIVRELTEEYPELEEAEGFLAILAKTVELTGNKFIVIIDEWDAPMRECGNRGNVQKTYLEFLRSLFKNSGVTDKVFAAAYMTGILPIRKNGSQSSISDFKEFSVLDPGEYAEYTGFTEDEVRGLCDSFHMDFKEARAWYDGYTFDRVHSVYNPYSVMSAMRGGKFRSYWKKTSAAEALLTYIDMNEDGLQDDIVRLVSGETIEVDTENFENDFETFKSRDDVLTLLIHLGYLSYSEDDQGTGTARIPNEEIRMEFNKILRRGSHEQLVRLIRKSDELLEKTLEGDAEAVASVLAWVHDSNYAPQYYNDEQALRAVVRYAYITCVDQYHKMEELPSGHGCADVVYMPKRRSPLPAMIIELKWNKTADGAITQIKDRNYPAVLKDYEGGLLLVGVNYDAKTKVHTCRIEEHTCGTEE